MPTSASEYHIISIFMQPNRGHTKVSPLNLLAISICEGEWSMHKSYQFATCFNFSHPKKICSGHIYFSNFSTLFYRKKITLNSLSLISILLFSLFPVFDCEIKYTLSESAQLSILMPNSKLLCKQVFSYKVNQTLTI